jgi:hypothetical protein
VPVGALSITTSKSGYANGSQVGELTADGTVTLNVTMATTVTPVPAIALALAPAAVAATSGTSVTSIVGITRAGGFNGDVSLVLENAPPGVTGTFSPAAILATSTSSSMSLAVGATVIPGTYTLSVRASGAGITSQTATILLTVATVGQGYSLTATGVSAQQGTSATSTVTITRTGNFTGPVALSMTGFPAGVTGTFSPTSATGTTSTLTLAIGSTVPVGTYTITVKGAVAGLADVSSPLTVVVTAAPPAVCSFRFKYTGVGYSAGFTPYVPLTNASGIWSGIDVSIWQVDRGTDGSPVQIWVKLRSRYSQRVWLSLGAASDSTPTKSTDALVINSNSTDATYYYVRPTGVLNLLFDRFSFTSPAGPYQCD